jgi:cytoskeleton protein RodZ
VNGEPKVQASLPARDTGAGEALARAREALGLSVADVAQQLKFAPRQIEALEQGRYGELPGGTFTRGMLRAYARLLKVDPEPLLARIAPSIAGPDNAAAVVAMRRPIPISDGARRTNLLYAALSLAVLAVAAAVVIEWQQERSRAAQLSFVSAARAPAQAPPAAPPRRTEVASTVTPQIAPLEPRAEPVPPAAGAPATGKRRIEMRFERESWVEIRGRGGRTLFSQLNRAGSSQTVEGEPPFAVVVGNAPHVRLSYDDRPFDLAPHTRLEVARFTLE